MGYLCALLADCDCPGIGTTDWIIRLSKMNVIVIEYGHVKDLFMDVVCILWVYIHRSVAYHRVEVLVWWGKTVEHRNMGKRGAPRNTTMGEV